MNWTVTVRGEPGVIRCPDGGSVLKVMAGAGQRLLPVGCRSGGCGVCRVRVLTGSYDLGRMSAAEISEVDRAAGIVLACQVFPNSDLEVEALGRKPREASPNVWATLQGG